MGTPWLVRYLCIIVTYGHNKVKARRHQHPVARSMLLTLEHQGASASLECLD